VWTKGENTNGEKAKRICSGKVKGGEAQGRKVIVRVEDPEGYENELQEIM